MHFEEGSWSLGQILKLPDPKRLLHNHSCAGYRDTTHRWTPRERHPGTQSGTQVETGTQINPAAERTHAPKGS